jgi:hypothetical protein
MALSKDKHNGLTSTNIFTKPLLQPLFLDCKRNLNMHSIVEIEGA